MDSSEQEDDEENDEYGICRHKSWVTRKGMLKQVIVIISINSSGIQREVVVVAQRKEISGNTAGS